ncbi:MAG: CHASE2 domain-containing protein [Desulfobacterales bacterium]|nr:CHASE2 domain-containing protein [Desulfobacterales bacterium]
MGIIKKHPTLVLGLSITILFLAMGFMQAGFLNTLDLKLYDVGMSLRSDPESNSNIVMVDIDDDTIEKLGRWPWPRALVAAGLEKIDAGDPRVIGLNFILSEPENNPGIAAIKELEQLFIQELLDTTGEKGQMYVEAMLEVQNLLDNDAALADAIAFSEKVILPVFFKPPVPGVDPNQGLAEILPEISIPNVTNPEEFSAPLAGDIILPVKAFLDTAKGIGHINLAYDMDGTARRERLLYDYNGKFIPAYTLRLASAFLNIPLKKVRVELGSAIHMGGTEIPLTPYSELLVSFKGPTGSFTRYSYFDILNDKIPLQVFKNKLVIVSASASGIMNPLSTPVDASMPLGEFTANTIWSILNNQFISKPVWAAMAGLVMIIVVGLIITFLLPRFKAMLAAGVFWFLVFTLAGGATYLFAFEGLWISITYPLLQLILGYIGVLSIKYFVTETGKEKVEGESAETNRMLGLSFQNQGMLDMAFDKLRRVPVDDEVKDILYNLALDFERKRQFSKAAAVFEYIEENDAKFKDVKDRKAKLMQASETMVFGEGFGGTAGDGLLSTGTSTKPTLGRYEIEKQLGKGAMGIVYLGKDPRINRTTAIKTFRFGDDLGAEETDKLKEKFFREAESAGTLSHPNIVTIYDAGDEQDLAFIAMEFLEGSDLEPYIKKDNLLPIRKVMDYCADVADALDYAHDKGIVHRDIKPANIMLIKGNIIKITDFGIARITATSQTQTGVVKGTPFYMSPEQFSGEKVDGRSDIFSLGTMLFQMLTGTLPFTGDSPPALMHQIMNVKHKNPRTMNPKIFKPLVTIIDKALEKEREKRYQRAMQMATHLRTLGKKIDSAIAHRKTMESE